MATKPLGSIFLVSSIRTSSPLTSDTDTPSSPAIRALIPTSFSGLPFTVKESKAKLCASTPGTSGVGVGAGEHQGAEAAVDPGHHHQRLGETPHQDRRAVQLPGKHVGEQVASVSLVHHEAPGPGTARAPDRGVHLPSEQQPKAVPVVRTGELLVALALVAGNDLVDVHRAPHSFHVRDDEHPEPRLVGNLLVTEGGR